MHTPINNYIFGIRGTLDLYENIKRIERIVSYGWWVVRMLFLVSFLIIVGTIAAAFLITLLQWAIEVLFS